MPRQSFQFHLKFLFGLQERVNRRQYFLWGISLMLVKYLGESLIYYWASGNWLPVQNFLNPMLYSRYPGIGQQHMSDFFEPVIMLWSLPFIWIGVGMSIRRSADAGMSPWWGVLFFVPGINYVLMSFPTSFPSTQKPNWGHFQVHSEASRVLTPVHTTLIFAVVGMAFAALSMKYFTVYASSLFMGAPFVLGLIQSFLLNQKDKLGFTKSLRYVAGTILLIHLLLLLFALEGILCLAMSFPLSLALALMGAVFGNGIAHYSMFKRTPPMMLLIALPILPWAESKQLQTHQDVVLSEMRIAVPPAKVWPHVIQFSELPPSTEWLFELGVAHPLRARIEGTGVGAVRYCEFSTGAFVEPITHWQEPERLAFDVRFQPEPMKELSFYDSVDAPHLHGFFRSVRGEFRLIDDGHGGTNLEGRTWYEMDIHPGWYWQIYGRWFIHQIHDRVLAHIKRLAEQKAQAKASL